MREVHNLPDGRAWAAALADHDAAVDACLAVLCRFAAGEPGGAAWHGYPARGGWSPAEEALHVALSYELGAAAAAGGPGVRGMQLRVPPARAWVSRRVLLPVLLAAGAFPRGGASPPELRPPPDEARRLDATALGVRLARAATEAAWALRAADAVGPGVRSRVRIVHAYFGALAPREAVRLLSAHARHHARHLARVAEGAGRGPAPRTSNDA